MFCPNCGNNLSDNDKFCPKCGKSLLSLEDTTKCPKCGEDRKDGNFCTKCGTRYDFKRDFDKKIGRPTDNTVLNIWLVISITVAIGLLFSALYYSS